MGMFANFSTEDLTESKDVLGGGYEPLASGIYPAVITLAYLGEAANSKAASANIHYKVGETEYREQIWFTNREGKNFYVDKQDGKTKLALPGYQTLDDLTLFITQKPLTEQDDGIEMKTVKLYNKEAKKELPTEVQCLTFLHGGEVQLAVLRQIEDKNAKGEDGQYHPTGETYTSNTIDKVFHPETRRTINEYKHGVETDEFATAWLAKNENKDRNRAKGAASGAGQSGTGSPAAKSSTPNLFG